MSSGPGEPSSKAKPEGPNGGFLRLLRAAAQISGVGGAAGSVGLTLWVGQRNPSQVLLLFFAGWVLSPFVAFVAADRISQRSSVLTRAVLHGVMLAVTLGSLAIYGEVVLTPPKSTPAFVFLVVPLGSWLLMAIVFPIAALIARTPSGRASDAKTVRQ